MEKETVAEGTVAFEVAVEIGVAVWLKKLVLPGLIQNFSVENDLVHCL